MSNWPPEKHEKVLPLHRGDFFAPKKGSLRPWGEYQKRLWGPHVFPCVNWNCIFACLRKRKRYNQEQTYVALGRVATSKNVLKCKYQMGTRKPEMNKHLATDTNTYVPNKTSDLGFLAQKDYKCNIWEFILTRQQNFGWCPLQLEHHWPFETFEKLTRSSDIQPNLPMSHLSTRNGCRPYTQKFKEIFINWVSTITI